MFSARSVRSGVRGCIKSFASLAYRARVEAAWEYSAEDFWHSQEQRFCALYEQSRMTVPFYRDRPASYPPLRSGRSTWDFLQELPLLPKETVRRHNTEFW